MSAPPVATHIWVPYRETSLYVEHADGTHETHDAERLHAVVDALCDEDREVRIHLDQSPRSPRRDPGPATDVRDAPSRRMT